MFVCLNRSNIENIINNVGKAVQGKYMNSFCDTSYLCTDLYFLCEYFLYLPVTNFSPITRVLVIETQSLVMYVSGKNKLRKALACSMPCGREGDLSEVI